MKPTTDLGALASAIHSDAYGEHPDHLERPCGCGYGWDQDVKEAQRLIFELGQLGFHIAADVALPESAPAGKRETSRKAAASIADLKGGMKGVYELVACNGSHGLTDEQINDQYPGFARSNGFPQLAGDSPRKRRMDLGDKVVDSGRTRPTRSGNDAIVWVAREALEVAA